MSLATQWTLSFGHLLPIGHLLRHELTSSRWLRIHSLPDSKRYPETEVEYMEVLRRHNAVAAEVLGRGASCSLIVSRHVVAAETINWRDESKLLGYKLEPTPVWGRPPCDNDGFYEFAVSTVVWTSGAFDHLIRAVADDRESNLVFFSQITDEVYAPYDGGADLFVRNTPRRHQLRDRWSRWLSSRRDGL